MKIVLSMLMVCSFLFSTVSAFAADTSWKITKTTWSDTDEKAYMEFVSLMGQAVEKHECRSFKECIQHPNNPYKGSDSGQLDIHVDCARLAYALRAYFAWKNGLPFSHVSDVVPRVPADKDNNLRYTKNGNLVSARSSMVATKNKLTDGPTYITGPLMDSVYTAVFRLEDENENRPGLESDYYPADISREAIRPGTAIYDPAGHVAIVYKVTDDGKIYFIDAHPDNSLTSSMYGTKFVRSRPVQGAGFKNFRKQELVGATYDANLGSYVGGKITVSSASAHKEFSIVQKYGTDNKPIPNWQDGAFILAGVKLDYYDYLRAKMSKGNLRIVPTEEVKSIASDLCNAAQDRVESVQGALTAGIQNKTHPERLPYNLYGTSGEWESYSTPSRDARFKTSFKELRDTVEKIFNAYQAGDPQIDYSGTDIKGDMLNAYLQTSQACKVNYTKSNGAVVSLDLENVRQRLFALSFDPYHCVELRWGASTEQELASCKDDSTKREWFKREVWLRNQIERTYDARMDYSLAELTGPKPGVGVANPPDVDVVKYLSQ
ncbi:hypothetical protein CIK05_01800 [Bdellovibrio sp. qaytius]|nr:hypothetical protein CIK05_01800 [Bdellovibrio sp. qaytius]